MAKQAGILKLKGTIDGLNFYTLNGKQFVRKAGGGFTGKAIKNKASMRRVRENAAEFGHCSKVNKAFRTALLPFYQAQRALPFHRRLMPLFTDIKDLDIINQRGDRIVEEGVKTEAGKASLAGFSFTPDCDPKQRLPFKMRYHSEEHCLKITDLNPKLIRFPAGASRLMLQFGVLDFNFKTLQNAVYLSNPRVVDAGGPIVSREFHVQIPENVRGELLPVVGLGFYLGENDGFSPLAGVERAGFCVVS